MLKRELCRRTRPKALTEMRFSSANENENLALPRKKYLLPTKAGTRSGAPNLGFRSLLNIDTHHVRDLPIDGHENIDGPAAAESNRQIYIDLVESFVTRLRSGVENRHIRAADIGHDVRYQGPISDPGAEEHQGHGAIGVQDDRYGVAA